MSVRLNGSIIIMEGLSRVEEAEPLLAWLQADGSRIVDLTKAEHVHAAVLQVLMALRPIIRGTGRDDFIQHWIAPALTGQDPGGPTPAEG